MIRFRTVIHAIVLSLSNLAAIAAGFVVWYYLREGVGPQIPTQVTVAVLVNTLGYGAWFLATHRTRFTGLRLRRDSDVWTVWFLAIPAGIAIFVPVHYLVEGYLTSAGNLVGLALYAAVVNLPIATLCTRVGVERRSDPAVG